jgi:hypothetical protein
MRLLWLALPLILIGPPARANSLTPDGRNLGPSHGIQWQPDREGLINDGSFEDGSCLDGLSGWACTTDNSCDWITDMTPLGLWNHDGNHIAWLGGYCAGQATCWTRICQEIFFDGNQLSWYWMAYFNDYVMEVSVTVDDHPVFEPPIYYFAPYNMLDYFQETADVSRFNGETHTLCFQMNNPDCARNLGDNIFVDYVELAIGTGLPTHQAQEFAFSVVKSLY